jgi:hypothetical protein
MIESVKIPSALRVVAYIQLVIGIYSMIGIIVLLFHGKISFQTGVLGIPIFFGLLKLRNGWRICAMVLLCFGMIICPIMFFASFSIGGPAFFELFGIQVTRIPVWFVSASTIPFFLLVLWQYRVLIRPDVRRLFLEARPRMIRL